MTSVQSGVREAVERVSARDAATVGLNIVVTRADLRTLLAALSSQAEVMEAMAKGLEALTRDAEANDCDHSQTRRGGTIWTICDDCGGKWADDEGGVPAYVEPARITNARTALSQYRSLNGDA